MRWEISRVSRRMRPVVLVVLGAGLCGAGLALREAHLLAARQLPAYLATRLSAALGRPVTVGRVLFWPPGAFTVEDFRVAAGAGDPAPPLEARQVRAYVDWWALLLRHRLRVTALHLDHVHLAATLDLRKPSGTSENATEQLLSLHRLGLDEIGIHHGEADLTTLLRDGERQPVTVREIDFTAGLHPQDFSYRARAASWEGAGLSARDLALQGRGDARSITITKSRVQFRGGALAANGTYVTHGGDVAMRVDVRELPLGNLAPQLGIPPEWAVHGNLTGTVQVSAASGALQSMRGRLHVARGWVQRSTAMFPWKEATAQVDWQPRTVALRDIDIQGDGIRLRGTGDVAGDPNAPFPARPFQAQGTLEVTRTDAVVSLGRLLAYNTPVAKSWGFGGARVSFDARGVVGQLQQAQARGHFSARELTLKPTPAAPPLTVHAVDGDMERTPDHLYVRNLRGSADGLSARGELTIVPTRAGRAGVFSGAGRVDLEHLALLHQQLPDLPLWRWLNGAAPAAVGQLQFRVNGPTQAPEKLAGAGSFHFRDLALRVPTGRRSGEWAVPVRALSGQVDVRGNRIALSSVTFRSDLFHGSAQGAVTDWSGRGAVSGIARLASDRWEQLPPLQGRLPAGLSGGTLVLSAHVPPGTYLHGGAARRPLAELPLAGALSLRGATYRTRVAGRVKLVQVQAASADFRKAGPRLTIPDYRLVTPQFRTSGKGSGVEVTRADGKRDWRLHAEGLLAAADAGALARWWSGQSAVDGGRLAANYRVDVPAGAPEQSSVNARVRLVDAQPHLAPGTLPFQPEEARIQSLTGTVTSRGGAVRFQDVVWQAPLFRLRGSGSVDGKVVDGSFRLATPAWRRLAGNLARTVPVDGGVLTAEGHVHGPVHVLSRVPFRGALALHGAHLVSDPKASLPLQGGAVDLTAEVHGPLTHLVGADVAGAFSVRNVLLPPLRAGAERVRLQSARGEFQRTGPRLVLSNLRAQLPEAELTGSGEFAGMGSAHPTHRFHLTAQGPALARVLPAVVPVPGKPAGGAFTGSVELSGGRGVPVRMEARAEVRDGAWTPPGQKLAMKISRMTAHFVRNGASATLDGAELRMPDGDATLAGRFDGLGTPGGARHQLQLTWRLVDASAWASRFLPVPGWFTGGLFTGQAQVNGSAHDPAATAQGQFEVKDAGFMPPQRFLGGPIRPISVAWARGSFQRAGHRTSLEKLDLNTAVGTATGTVTADDHGLAEIHARGEISRLQALVDLWPGFSDRLQGGRGELTVDLHGPLRQPRALAGTAEIIGREGVLTVAGADPPYRTEPFDELSTLLRLGGGQVRLERVRMRGPKANLDGQGVIFADGKLQGEGKAWFSEKFSRTLVKPRILWPLAKLVGLKRIHTRYQVSGSLREARLHTSIAHGLIWDIAIKKQVPEPMRSVATGKTPLWGSDRAAPSRTARR